MSAPRVLFVDDDANVLAGLRRMLRSRREPWDAVFAGGGAEALTVLATGPVDAVVTDMRMPGMDGAALLDRVRREHPATARIVLSGHADRDAVISAAGPTQQYLAKPCAPETLVAAVGHVLAVRDLVTDQTWRERIGALTSLPKPPAVYDQLVALARRPETDLHDVVRVVESDVALTTEVLKLVNSAFFALVSQVHSVERAVGLLGLDVLQALALAGTVFRPTAPPPPGLDAAELGRRSLRIAMLSRRIAVTEGWDDTATGVLCLAALLHDVGLLVLAGADPAGWMRLAAVQEDRPGLAPHEAQQEAFGLTAAQASAHLLGLWGFSRPVLDLLAEPPIDLAGTDPGAGPHAGPTSPAAIALAFARLRALHPDAVPIELTYLDAARLERWNAACSPLASP